MKRTEILQYIFNSICKLKDSEKVIFIEGEAGIGKTTLIKQLVDNIDKSDVECQYAISECSTPIAGNDIGQFEALSPWIKILHDLEFDTIDIKQKKKELVVNLSHAVLKLIPYVGYFISDTASALHKHKKAVQRSDSSLSASNQRQIFSQNISYIKNISSKKKLIIIIDDFHWADDSSVNFLFSAARQLKSNQVYFIISYRNEDILTSRNGKGHPLLRIKNELERYSLSKTYTVSKLHNEEFQSLMVDRYQIYKNDKNFETWLLKISSGNPLFIKQYLKLLEDEGFIHIGDFNVKQGYQNIKVPVSANAVISERLNRLDKHHRDLLSYASIEGEYFTSLVLSVLSDLNKLELIKELRTIEEKFTIIKTLGSQKYYFSDTTLFVFAQFIFQKIFYDNLTGEEKKILHESAFNVIEKELKLALDKKYDVTNLVSRLIIHAEMSEKYLKTVELLYQSSVLNWEKFARDESISLIEKALKILNEKCNEDKHKIELLKAKLFQFKSGIEVDYGNLREALIASEIAIDLYSKLDNVDELVESLNIKIWTLSMMQNHKIAEETALYALHIIENNDSLKNKAKIFNVLGDCYSRQGNLIIALNYFNKSLMIKEQMNDNLGIATSYINIGTVYMGLKDYKMALEYSFKALDIFLEIGSPNNIATCHNNIAVCYEDFGDFENALKYNLLSLELKEKIGNNSSIAKTIINIGDIYLKLNKIKVALDNYEKAYLLLDEIYDKDWLIDLSKEISELCLKIGVSEKSKLYLEKHNCLINTP